MIALLLATAINSHATVTLKAPEAFERGGAQNEIVLQFDVKPNWHIYWRNPGDSGEEPRATWKSSRPDVSVGELEYPIPSRLAAGPFTNFGYSRREGGVPFRVPVTVAPGAGDSSSSSRADSVELSLALTYLVCQEECVPEKADLKLKVPIRNLRTGVGSAANSSGAPAVVLSQIEERLFPKRLGVGSRAEPHRLKYVFVNTSAAAGVDADKIQFEMPDGWGSLEGFEFFPLTPQVLAAGDKGLLVPATSARGRSQFEAAIEGSVSTKDIPANVVGLLVDTKNQRAEWAEFEVSQPFNFIALLRTLGFAFLGGLILNLMPCVFPVVSLKVLSFVREGGGDPRDIRRHAYAYAGGILVSLWLLVGVLLGIRAAGAAVGWGFQLQNPIFLFVLLGIFFVLGLNLLGAFEINYSGPAKLHNLMMKRGLMGSFFTGLLTTVVATPCSAPFMGVAIGSALAAGTLEAFAVLTMLGLGLASPYLVLAFKPSWVNRLPRPGAWMERLKEFLAFPLFLTSVWLFWVLTQTVDVGSLIPVLAWCVFAGMFAWARGKNVTWNGVRVWVWLTSLLLALTTYAVFVSLKSVPESATGVSSNAAVAWQPYSDSRLQVELAAGRAVFVDFTASWCVTCQINKKLVLQTADATSLFESKKIVRLQADWTKRDTEITNALSRLGRNSVPVYAFYGAGKSKPMLLPEILTLDILKQSLEEK